MKLSLSILIFFQLFKMSLHAQAVYSLEECYRMALRSNITIQKSRNDLSYAAAEKKSAGWQKHWHFSSSANIFEISKQYYDRKNKNKYSEYRTCSERNRK